MKVLQLHNTYLEAGGEDGVVLRERELLTERRHQVETIQFQNPEEAGEQAKSLLFSNWNRSSAKRVAQVVDGAAFDITHVHNTWYQASPSAVAAAARQTPVVATLHNYRRVCLNAYLFRENSPCTDCVGHLPWRGVVRGCYRDSRVASTAIGVATGVNRAFGTLDRVVDRYLVLSDFAAELAEKTGVDADRIVRHDNFVPDPGPRTVLASDSSTVLAVGRLSQEKGFVDLLRAWNRTPTNGLELVIVGDGPDRERLRSLAGSDVHVVGRKSGEEVSALMRSSRALVFPSRWYEGQPLVILEALAAGLPVISSDHPPLREVLGDSSQILVDEDNWREALEQVADDSWTCEASKAARSRFEDRYSPEVAGDRLEGIYKSVLR